MKSLSNIKLLKALAPVFILIILSGKVYSQRCGDGILFSFTDSSNQTIDFSRLNVSGFYFDSYYWDKDAEVKPGMKLKYPEYYQVQKDTIYISNLNGHIDWKDKTHFYIRTFCSMLLMRVKIVYNNQNMQLDIYNIPGDVPYKMVNVIFAPGKFDININGYYDYKGTTKDTDGVYVIKFDDFKPTD